MTATTWIGELDTRLDALERALLQGDAPGVQHASAAVQTALQQAPRALNLQGAAAQDLQSAAQRFAQLRAATLRAAARTDRALGCLLPEHRQQPTYRPLGARAGSAFIA